MSGNYLTCVVKISEESLKEHLCDYLDESEVENMSTYELQAQATQAVEGVLGDFFSDYWVIDEDSIVIGEL